MASIYTQIAKKRSEESKQSSPSQEGKTDVEPTPSSHGDTVVSRHHDTAIPQHHDTAAATSAEADVETVRSAVKHFGKEPATQRLTTAEKQDLEDIEYAYKKRGIRTSGNEIIRIALNSLVLDYKRNGESSMLAKVLKRLNS